MADTEQGLEQKSPPDAAEQADAKTKVQNVDFPEAADSPSAGPGSSIDILLDMNVAVTVVIGETRIPVRTLLQLGPGSVVRLDKSIEAPADLYLRETKFATGTIVVVEDRFAVRIGQILTPGDASKSADK
jgi:flagellar motor switch protein FliN/FliY